MTADVGTIELPDCESLEAGAWVTLVFRYMAGPCGLRNGAVLRIGLPNTGWSEPLAPLPRFWPELSGKDRVYAPFRRVNTSVELITRSQAQGYLRSFTAMATSNSDNKSRWDAGEKMNWRHWIDVVIEAGRLSPKDEIRVTYGDKRFGEPGARVQAVPETSVVLTAYLDAAGNGEFIEVAGSPLRLQVHPGSAGKARVAVPSIVRPGKSFVAQVSVTDCCGNRPRNAFVGSLRACAPSIDWVRKLSFDEAKASHTEAAGLVLKAEDVARVTINGDLPATRSNPVLCSASADQIFWGDIHVHSMYHDYSPREGRGVWRDVHPNECFQYAKEVSFLDFVAITDSSPMHAPAGWEETQASVNEHYQPNKFVTFCGFEAGSEEGHRNALFATGGIEPPFPHDLNCRFPDIHNHFRGRSDVLMIPHHTKAFMNWDYHDPELEPVVEVYSSWGSSERPGPDLWEKMSVPGNSVQEALGRGFRLGMVGSGDICPWPGRCSPGTKHCLAPYRGGLAAVFAEELTREAIFEAIRSRRCYATTGARIIVRFEVNGAPMGQEARLSASEQPRQIRTTVIGTDRITRVEIIKNCEVLTVSQPTDESFEWTVEDDSPCSAGDFYYVRATQADGHRVWSSPVWIEIGKGKES